MRSPVDSSSFGSSAPLPFPDKPSNTLGLARGQIDQDRKDGRTIQKVQGPVSAAGTAPHKSTVRGRGNYGSSAPAATGRAMGSLNFVNVRTCVCLIVCVLILEVYEAAASGTCNACAPSPNCGHMLLCT